MWFEKNSLWKFLYIGANQVKVGNMCQRYYWEKGVLGTSNKFKILRVDYDRMDDILAKIAKANGVLQRMDTGKNIGTQAIPQKVDGDTNSNIDPTSRVI